MAILDPKNIDHFLRVCQGNGLFSKKLIHIVLLWKLTIEYIHFMRYYYSRTPSVLNSCLYTGLACFAHWLLLCIFNLVGSRMYRKKVRTESDGKPYGRLYTTLSFK